MSDIEQLDHEPATGPDYAAAQRLAAIVESSDDAIISRISTALSSPGIEALSAFSGIAQMKPSASLLRS